MKYLLLIFIFGCSAACRPMSAGDKWAEKEIFNSAVGPGKYQKDCFYTEVKDNGDYSFNCIYNPEAVNDLRTDNAE